MNMHNERAIERTGEHTDEQTYEHAGEKVGKYLVQVEGHQHQHHDIRHRHAAQVKVGGTSHLRAEPHYQDG